jgi:lysophospholipase L1-like esterase
LLLRRIVDAALIIFCCALLAITASCGDDDGTPNPTAGPMWSHLSGGVYISLGDSVAAGNGASDAQDTGFAALVARETGTELRQYAVAGATTQAVIERQLPDAVDETAGEDVVLVTISAGGNDLAALIPNPACRDDPPPATCPLDPALDAVGANLRAIVDHARQRWPDARIVLLAYPNFFSGTGHEFDAPAGRVLPRLGDVIRGITGTTSNGAVAQPSFEGRARELTHVLDPMFDPHPNDAGHRIIADAFLAALDTLDADGG